MTLRDDLKAYLDGELPEARRAEIESALARDPEVAAELEQLRAIRETLRGGAPAFLPAGLESTLRALDKAAAPPWWSRPAVLAAAACVAVIAIALPLLQQSEPQYAGSLSEVALSSSSGHPPNRMEGVIEEPSETTALAPATSMAGDASSDRRELVLESTDVKRSIETVRKLASDLGGSIAKANARTDDGWTVWVHLPSEKWDEAQKRLGGVMAPSVAARQRSQLLQEDKAIRVIFTAEWPPADGGAR